MYNALTNSRLKGRVWEEIIIIGVLLETSFHWSTIRDLLLLEYYWRPSFIGDSHGRLFGDHIFIGDPQIFIGDSIFFLETPRFPLETPRFSLETPDFNLRPPDYHLEPPFFSINFYNHEN